MPISEICVQIHLFRHPIPECMSRDHHAVGFACQGKQSASARSVVSSVQYLGIYVPALVPSLQASDTQLPLWLTADG